ncbi:hypothetical protein [Roseovarius rhodophyticola]|uniref:DUF4189 domain-containing protein n=1 Tax=Roseovarius rhodophyticola TaxID=3080827 RepID=A0ABZ2TB49_9RHOB|nr:hypothetical protein [Roseovarius sp. W115]MDV2930621.1 hypothetical protein [Roseovarius sp. W115]
MSRENQSKHLKAALLGVAVCAIIVSFRLFGGGPERLVPYLSEPVISVTGDAPLSGSAAEDYESLVENADYYAAFAMGEAGGHGWSDNHSTQDMADASALAWCEEYDAECRVILRIAPAAPLTLDDLPLSKTSALALSEYKSRPSTKAIALSETGVWGMSWGQDTKKSAVTVAVKKCQERLNMGFPDRRTYGTCRLVWFD